jgi:hypothetical protein
MRVQHPRFTLLAAACAALLAAPAAAQAPAARPDTLFNTVAALDSALFDAYNRCDLATLGALVSEDLEFYHDKTGLAVGRAPFVESIRKYVCGNARRDLVPGTLEVHALAGYGAVEIGEHLFCDPKTYQRCADATSGIARFVMLWRHEKGAWQLTRVVSFAHLDSHERAPAKKPAGP